MYDQDLPYAYNRKEAKDHGEGGVLVGASMEGKRVLIVDDVITAGTAIGEAMSILKKASAKATAVCISLDRQEKVAQDDTRSAIQVVKEKYGIEVISIANLNGLVSFLESSGTKDSEAQVRIKAYRDEYGVL